MRAHHCSPTIALVPVMATLIALLTTTVTMAAPAPPSLESYKAKYEAATFVINLEHQKSIDSLSDSYTKAIASSIETLRAKGDPEPVLKAGAENARFAIDGTVPNPPNEKLPQLVQHMQSEYHKLAAAAGTDRDAKLVSLIGKYVPAINRLMHQYTTEGKMSLAMEVKAEKERVGFILADIGSRQPSPSEKETGKPELLTSTIILSGVSWKQRWMKQSLKVSKGWKISIIVEPEDNGVRTQEKYSHDSLRVRLGEGSKGYVFDTNGKYNWTTRRRRKTSWHYKPLLVLTATDDCSLYFWEELGQRLKVTVKIEPPESRADRL